MKHEEVKRVLALRDDLADWFLENEHLLLDQKWDEAAELLISDGWVGTERLLAPEKEGVA